MLRRVWFFLVVMSCFMPRSAQAADTPPADTAAERSLAAAADAGQYAIVVFYKEQNPATQAMISTIQQGVQQRPGRATALYVNAASATDRSLVNRFGVSRTPMPVAVAVAPNGAITGIFAKTISLQRLDGAFVSPGVANCMKWMQAGKLVFVWARAGQTEMIPVCIDDFQRDAEFAGRSGLVTLDLNDPAEASFFKELQINTHSREDVIGLLAPPGMLVGTFSVSASKGDIAAKLHKAGKCCDDPNCKHNKAH